ncbi:putative ATPase [Sinobacterium caligoides]|uniref:Replication-associated recombination protein A n=1 Tax=Sinobacterium caligoides TaxID=933926 RepID=A0A3N2DXP0_9GAMM|nr:replication-associated recombination protein A [Sinobacterium caligoides]ROS04557.1 putative ATPase [Sinobacterium caligoides]
MLFDDHSCGYQPLAAKLRPTTLAEYSGQLHILASGKPLREALDRGQLHSMIFWGPPGVGKTTLAKLIAEVTDAHFETMSAVLAGVKDIREAVERAKQRRAMNGAKTILFVDEVHRFNKGQQDAFLPHIEDGTVIFVGATTENPSFELNNALLSRCRVYILQSLPREAIVTLLERALTDPKGGLIQRGITTTPDVVEKIAVAADGDARRALNILEVACDLIAPDSSSNILIEDQLEQVLAGELRRFDKGGDIFYEQISALHKSIRGSSTEGALYWFCRMIDGGCDPLYIARRLVTMASEDIGNADPRALEITLNAWDAFVRLGSGEGERALAQAVLYLAAAPKSNAVYTALNEMMAMVRGQPSYDVPIHLRNAPTSLMQELNYGGEYRYAHNYPDAFAAGECYLPEEVVATSCYRPVQRGLEIKISDKLKRLELLDNDSQWQRYKPVED